MYGSVAPAHKPVDSTVSAIVSVIDPFANVQIYATWDAQL